MARESGVRNRNERSGVRELPRWDSFWKQLPLLTAVATSQGLHLQYRHVSGQTGARAKMLTEGDALPTLQGAADQFLQVQLGMWCPEVVVGYILGQTAPTGAGVMPTPGAQHLFVPTGP